MCGIYDYRARRVLFAVQLQDRGEHRARYVTAHETFEIVVITLFNFEQGTDGNYYDFFFCIASYFYSVWIPYFEPRLRKTRDLEVARRLVAVCIPKVHKCTELDEADVRDSDRSDF